MDKHEILQQLAQDAPRYYQLSDSIWDTPEVRFTEHRSARTLAKAMEEEGFTTEWGLAGIDTAFRCTWGSGKPVIGFLAEYDALRDDGLRYANRLLEHFPPAVLKGNYAEINALARPDYTASGVDGDKALTPAAAARAAGELARRYDCVVLASGAADLVADGTGTTAIHNGTPQLGSVTGTGCMLGALCACFLAAASPLEAAKAACVTLGVAGEKAATPKGSGTFLVNLLDQLSTLDGETIQACERTEEFCNEEP